MAGALAQILPDGDRERTMLLGLTGNKESLAEAAAKSGSVFEELTLFDV
jgi:putative DNA methylase